MSDALDKAEAAVREASTDTAAVQLAFAAMELAKLAQQQPAPPQAEQQAPVPPPGWPQQQPPQAPPQAPPAPQQ